MKLRKKNMARLASISALGAGALGVSAENAAAGPIVYTPLNGEVGFYPGANTLGTPSTFRASLPSLPRGFSLYFRRSVLLNSSGNFAAGFVSMGGNSQLVFRAMAAAAGSKWSRALVGGTSALQVLGERTAGGSTHHPNNPLGTFYKLFAFGTINNFDFGWVKLDESLGSTSGPDLKIEGFAYDTSGAPIAAGDTGQAPTPEPSTAALASLSALALGAVGVRRWRSVRKPAA